MVLDVHLPSRSYNRRKKVDWKRAKKGDEGNSVGVFYSLNLNILNGINKQQSSRSNKEFTMVRDFNQLLIYLLELNYIYFIYTLTLYIFSFAPVLRVIPPTKSRVLRFDWLNNTYSPGPICISQ